MDKFVGFKYLVKKVRQLKAEKLTLGEVKRFSAILCYEVEYESGAFFWSFYSRIDILRIPILLHHCSNFKKVPCLKFLKLS